jgi:lipopolysaccharide assembly protein A
MQSVWSTVVWALKWGFRALVFLALFAFALNNPNEVTVNWFFGYQSRAPLVLVVLCTFAIGLACGVAAMVPRWWRSHQAARQANPTPSMLSEADVAVEYNKTTPEQAMAAAGQVR